MEEKTPIEETPIVLAKDDSTILDGPESDLFVEAEMDEEGFVILEMDMEAAEDFEESYSFYGEDVQGLESVRPKIFPFDEYKNRLPNKRTVTIYKFDLKLHSNGTFSAKTRNRGWGLYTRVRSRLPRRRKNKFYLEVAFYDANNNMLYAKEINYRVSCNRKRTEEFEIRTGNRNLYRNARKASIVTYGEYYHCTKR